MGLGSGIRIRIPDPRFQIRITASKFSNLYLRENRLIIFVIYLTVIL
jgi:hypothetical protein